MWVDLEYNGKKYNPGKDDLLVAELTSGWMRRSLFGQGLKREFDHEGEKQWCMFIYQPTEGNVEYIQADSVVAKVTSQHLDVDWPPLPAPGRAGGTTQRQKKKKSTKKPPQSNFQ